MTRQSEALLYAQMLHSFPGARHTFFASQHMWVEGCSSPAGWLKQASVEEGNLIAPAFTS
jgi:hypothetical protein